VYTGPKWHRQWLIILLVVPVLIYGIPHINHRIKCSNCSNVVIHVLVVCSPVQKVKIVVGFGSLKLP
jgi:hypothetical protein